MLDTTIEATADTSASPVRTPRVGIALIALGAFAVEMAVSGRYGYVRDERLLLTLRAQATQRSS